MMPLTKRKRLSEEIKNGTKYLSTGLIIILLITGTFFLLNIGSTSQNGYRFRQNEQMNEDLISKNHQLKLKVLEAASFSTIQSTNTVKDMTTATEIDFYESRMDRLSQKNN